MNETTEILKIDTKGRVRTPREKQEEILHEYETSGMTGRQFARHAGIKYSTLMSWTQRRKVGRPDSIGAAADRVKSEQPGFQARQWIEAVVQDVRTSFVVEVAGGLALNIGSEDEAKLAAVVLRGLGYGRSC